MADELKGIRQWLTRLGEWAAHPGAYSIIVVYAVLWFVFDRASLDWHGIATLGVWFMTLLIQRTEHRDTQALHGEIRRHMRELKDRQRMAFLEAHAADVAVASALLSAPPFLSGLSESELTFVKHRVEQVHLPPAIAEARAKTAKALGELERASRRATSLILEFAGLKHLPARPTNEPPSKPKAKAKATTPHWSKPTATTVNSTPKPEQTPDWA